MVTVEFLGPISKEPISVDITNLEQLSEILKGDESLKPWLQNSAVAVNDVLVQDKSHSLNEGDKVSLLPPVCGG
ncbi:MAG: MoaD/ThiS family protein [Campylobacterota bacterium]|nr:MoaD/ThiS family protein [Campylobacterota bacterium]